MYLLLIRLSRIPRNSGVVGL